MRVENERLSEETKREDQWFEPEQVRVIKEHLYCLFGSARALADLSDEPAETIVKAALSSCDAKADQVRQLYHKYGDALEHIYATFGLGDDEGRKYAEMADELLKLKPDTLNKLILTVIEERARHRNERDKQKVPDLPGEGTVPRH